MKMRGENILRMETKKQCGTDFIDLEERETFNVENPWRETSFVDDLQEERFVLVSRQKTVFIKINISILHGCGYYDAYLIKNSIIRGS